MTDPITPQDPEVPTGDQNGTDADNSAIVPDKPNVPDETQGGPSDEWKTKRLEQENKDLRESLKVVKERSQSNQNADLSDEERSASEMDDFYKERARDGALKAVEKSLAKVPEAMRKVIEQNPFKFIDQDILELELLRIDESKPKEVWEATRRAAEKSLPSFIESVAAPDTTVAPTSDSKGVNPPITSNDPASPLDAKTAMSLPMDELEKRIMAERRANLNR